MDSLPRVAHRAMALPIRVGATVARGREGSQAPVSAARVTGAPCAAARAGQASRTAAPRVAGSTPRRVARSRASTAQRNPRIAGDKSSHDRGRPQRRHDSTRRHGPGRGAADRDQAGWVEPRPLGHRCGLSRASRGSERTMPRDARAHADRLAGRLVEGTMAAHHRRRLRRLGHAAAVDPPADGRLWAAGDPPPRAGQRARGAHRRRSRARRDRARRCAARARTSTSPAGASRRSSRSTRDEPPVVLRELLAETAERVDVRVLMWAGRAAARCSRPKRARRSREAREELSRGTRMQVRARRARAPDALPPREARDRRRRGRVRRRHRHHLASAATAGTRATHPARGRLGWHDARSRLRGPRSPTSRSTSRMRWREVTGEPLPRRRPPPPPRATSRSRSCAPSPSETTTSCRRGDFRILEAYVRALRSAERLVYLESQFLWSPEIVEILAAQAPRPPTDDFRVVVLLPAHAEQRPGRHPRPARRARRRRRAATPRRFLAATISARTGRTARPRSTSTRRSGSSTTAG